MNYNTGRWTEDLNKNDAVIDLVGWHKFYLNNYPIVPYSVQLIISGYLMANDDGLGNMSGGGTIDYNNGVLSLKKIYKELKIEYAFDYEQNEFRLKTHLEDFILKLVD